MIMTEAEIVRRYKGWPDKPKYAVQGLADLNGCDKYEIVEILYKNGAINRQSLAAYVRNGKAPASLMALFNEDGEAKAQPDTKETRELPKEPQPAAPVRAELPDSVHALVAARLDEMEADYKRAFEICREYEELKCYLSIGIPLTNEPDWKMEGK